MLKTLFPAHVSRIWVGLIIAILPTASPAQTSVLTQHNDNNRDGVNSVETALTPANVNGAQFGLLFKAVVDDQIYAQPLYMAHVQIANGTHNVVFVATTNNSVYAFDADSGVQYWHVSLGPAFTVQDGGFTCGDVLASSGIMSTPVIEASTNTLYVVAETWVNNTASHNLHALNVATGADIAGSPVTISASGFNSVHENQRAGLLLSNNNIYITFAGHCDQGNWAGFTFAYSASNLSQVGVFNASPDANGASMWQSGNGPAADSSGDVYFITGNGTWDGANNFSETFLKMDSSLKLLDWHTPSNYGSLDDGDQDLTSSGPLLIPGTSLMVGGGKDGVLHLVNTSNMGHLGDANALQNWHATSSHIHSMNYWNGNLYLWGQGDFMRVYSFNGSTFNTTPKYELSTQAFAHPGGSLSLSANGNSNGILWAATNTTYGTDGLGAWHSTVPGILYAYNASNMNLLWTNQQNAARDSCNNYAKFTAPTIANGKVYLASFGTANTASGQLCAYGQLPTANLISNGTYALVGVNSGAALDDPMSSTTPGEDMEIYAVNNGTNQQWTVTNLGNNVITLTNGASGMLLDVAEASTSASALIDQWPANGQTNQQWKVISVGGGAYELASVGSGMALDVAGGSNANGAQIHQYPYNGNPWQQWIFKTPSSQLPPPNLISNGTYMLVGVNSGAALDDPMSSTTPGEDMEIYAVNNGANQQWTVTNLGDNVITLTNVASGMLLDVAEASGAASAVVDQWPANGQTNQEWKVISVGGGAYELVSVGSGMALDVAGGSNANGTQIHQYPYNGNPWQQWIFRAP
ncbi:MAG TPA: RICIN domain-containing protein [Terracidiphilus sp.]|nr:RICIN domain-containing protein [Terracidiphilus sp.]